MGGGVRAVGGKATPPYITPSPTQGPLPPMPILGRQPGRELEECPLCVEAKRWALSSWQRESSWPGMGEVRVPTAGVVCPDGVSETRLLAVLQS